MSIALPHQRPRAKRQLDNKPHSNQSHEAARVECSSAKFGHADDISGIGAAFHDDSRETHQDQNKWDEYTNTNTGTTGTTGSTGTTGTTGTTCYESTSEFATSGTLLTSDISDLALDVADHNAFSSDSRCCPTYSDWGLHHHYSGSLSEYISSLQNQFPFNIGGPDEADSSSIFLHDNEAEGGQTGCSPQTSRLPPSRIDQREEELVDIQRGRDRVPDPEQSIEDNPCSLNLSIYPSAVAPGSPLLSLTPLSGDVSAQSSDYEDDIIFNGNQSLFDLPRGPLLSRLISTYYNNIVRKGDEPGEADRSNHKDNSNPSTSATAQQGIATSSQYLNSPNAAKRRRENSSQGRDNDEEGNEEPEPPAKKRVRCPKESVLWACPFAKWKPLSYLSCSKYIMKDINRVKQHLRRNHMRPPHCPTCWETFKDEEIFYSHIGSRTCSLRLKVDLEGMTATQQKHLEERVDRKLSKSDQWYSVFSILFPDSPRPSSAYLDSNLSSQLLSFKQFMATDGLEIVEETAREHIPENLRGNSFGEEVIEFSKLLFQQAVPELLKRFEATSPHGTSDSGYGTSTDGPSSHHSIQDGHKVDAWKMQTILETNEQILAEAEGCHADPMAASTWPDATCSDTGDCNLLNDDMGSLFDGIELGLGGDFGELLG